MIRLTSTPDPLNRLSLDVIRLDGTALSATLNIATPYLLHQARGVIMRKMAQLQLTDAYAKQHNGNWTPLTLPVKLGSPGVDIEPLPTTCTLQVWLDWPDVEAIMRNVRTQHPRAGNWHELMEGGALPDIGIYVQDQWGRRYCHELSRVYIGRGCIVSMQPTGV